MASAALPKGLDVYHGTNSPDDFTIPRGPAWFGDSYAVAKYFSTWHGDEGQPRILHFRVKTRVPKLFLVNTAEDFDKLADKMGVEGGESTEDRVELVCNAGFDGWIIPNNYPEGADILLCNPEKWLEFVDVFDVES